MPDYERSTTATTRDALPDPVREALREHASASQLTLDPDAPAFVTRSRRLGKPGLLAR